MIVPLEEEEPEMGEPVRVARVVQEEEEGAG